jgi:hypothetical protein
MTATLALGATINATKSDVVAVGTGADAAVAAAHRKVVAELEKAAACVRGWRVSGEGAEEVVGIPEAITLTDHYRVTGDFLLVTVSGTARVGHCVVDTRTFHDD